MSFGHVTNMAAMPVMVKSLKKEKQNFFSGTNGLIALKLGM